MKKLLLSALVLGVTFAAPAMAEDYGSDDKKRSEKHRKHRIDTNEDGVVSKSEFMAAQEKKFKELDANNNGKIEREEFKKFHAKMKNKRKEWHKERKERKEEAKGKREERKEKRDERRENKNSED